MRVAGSASREHQRTIHERRGATILGLALALLLPLGPALATDPVAPGPPFPEPTIDRAVMERARSMDQVVREAGLSWLETPDQAVVWSVALGLADQVEDVLGRTMADSEAAGTQVGFLPTWYRGQDGTSLSSAASRGFGGAGGLFSSSGVPDIGGMISTLGTIGSAPSSGGSGGGGGFSGGGFSGGGSGGGGSGGGGF